jgi:hypothetical protein
MIQPITGTTNQDKGLVISMPFERQTHRVVILYSDPSLGKIISTYAGSTTSAHTDECGDYAASYIVRSMKEIESGNVPLYNTVEELLAGLDTED